MKHSSYKNIFGFVAFFLKDIPKISKAYHLIMEREKEIPLPYFVLSKNCDGVVTLSFYRWDGYKRRIGAAGFA